MLKFLRGRVWVFSLFLLWFYEEDRVGSSDFRYRFGNRFGRVRGLVRFFVYFLVVAGGFYLYNSLVFLLVCLFISVIFLFFFNIY